MPNDRVNLVDFVITHYNERNLQREKRSSAAQPAYVLMCPAPNEIFVPRIQLW